MADAAPSAEAAVGRNAAAAITAAVPASAAVRRAFSDMPRAPFTGCVFDPRSGTPPHRQSDLVRSTRSDACGCGPKHPRPNITTVVSLNRVDVVLTERSVKLDGCER
ncbi:hypothetical protein GCM10009754_83040 [Amycolatopsis minnesotensis]|uniref:Uncharacterized protein n=1 Tax=Amycolatopsis minnesotensis TaxID=337894 RepID=A0ABP5E5V1_9PSEU